MKRPGLQVRSRGAQPLRRKTPSITRASTLAPAIVDALQGPRRGRWSPIRLFAAPYKGSDQRVKVAIAAEFGVEALNLTGEAAGLPARSPSRCGRRPAEGKLLRGQRHEMTLAFKPEVYTRSPGSGASGW